VATPYGVRKSAFVPTPSKEPAAPFPTKTDTEPAGVTAKMEFTSGSATYAVPPASTSTPYGVPREDAIDVTEPLSSERRRYEPAKSVEYRAPVALTLTSPG
jgi:hypothetical protein